MLTIDNVYRARNALNGVARKTDVIHATKLCPGTDLYLKTENLQVTGSFKVRGAYYKMTCLSDEEKARGVIACSAGNHAQGVALAAKANGIKNYSGKASQNTKMLKLLKKGELIKPGSGGSSGNVSVSYTSAGGEAVYNEASAHLDQKYGSFDGLGFHRRKWCADYVSWCASNAGQSDAIPWNASVSGLRSAIKDAGGTEYSKSEVKNGSYTPVKGDIIVFKSNDASHIGVVDCTSNGRIYYIDGNNTSYGNDNNSCVHYSDCSVSKKTFTCVLKPNYR